MDSSSPVSEDLWRANGLHKPWGLYKGLYSSQEVDATPSHGIEVALWGRSNVGKSTLLNSIMGVNVARTGGTPGVTRAIMIYSVENKKRRRNVPPISSNMWLIDLPGYGYARLGHKQRSNMWRLVEYYLSHRHSLHELWVLIDGMIGMKTSDHEALDLACSRGIPVRVVLTKCDRLSSIKTTLQLSSIKDQLKSHHLVLRGIHVWGMRGRLGLDGLQHQLALSCSLSGDS